MMTKPQGTHGARFASVVLDMDGLMFNTEELYDQVGGELLLRRGIKFSLAHKKQMMGRKAPDAFVQLKQLCKLRESAEQLMEESDRIMDRVLEETRLLRQMPGLDTLLDLLEDLKIPKAVATSSRRIFADRLLQQFRLADRFEFVLSGDDVIHGKPHPEIYHRASERLNVVPAAMIVLEDSLMGSQAAVSAGAFTVAIPSQPMDPGEFDHVDLIVNRLDAPELLGLLAVQ